MVGRIILLVLAAFSWTASAQVTLGTSNQNVTLTGIGGNVLNEGQSVVTWGSCVYDGANTVCTVSGPFTGLGNGGTYNFVLTYQGNGTSPLLAISDTPGDNFTYFSLSSGSFTTSLTLTNGPTIHFYSPTFTYYFPNNAVCTPAGISCAVGKIGLTQGATITGPVNGNMTTIPQIRTPQGVIGASAYGAFSAVAPGDWMEIYGINLANVLSQLWGSADFRGNAAPTALGGTTVTIGGQSAFIDYVSPGQVNAQVPSNVPLGLQPVVVTTAGGSSVAYTIQVNATQPGLLAPGSFALKAGQYIAALFPDGRTYVLAPGAIPGIPSARAKPGDTIIFYGVGFGPVTPDSPAGQIVAVANNLASKFQVSFAGVPATVSFSGLTGGYVGLYQMNVVVPNIAASDTVPVTFTLGSNAGAQTLLIAIQN